MSLKFFVVLFLLVGVAGFFTGYFGVLKTLAVLLIMVAAIALIVIKYLLDSVGECLEDEMGHDQFREHYHQSRRVPAP